MPDVDTILTPYRRLMVRSVHVHVSRCLQGFAFPPGASRVSRRVVERLLANALLSLEGTDKGKYLALSESTEGASA